MAASDAAFSRSFNRAEETRKRDAASGRAETRQQTADERQDILFNRSTSLFEQQQKFLKDDRALEKYGRDANRAVSMFRASGGQVYQPMLDIYKSLPDGGQFHNFRRNDNGSFDYEIEWQGQRFKKQGASFDEVGNMMMSISNPAQYIAQSGAAAAAQQDFENKKELQRIKGLKGTKPTRLLEGTNLTHEEYQKARSNMSDDYFKLRDAVLDNPDDKSLMIQDDEAEGGFRVMTLDEYRDQEFGKIGVNVAGAVIGEQGAVEQRPLVSGLTDSFTEIFAHFNSEGFGAADEGEAFEFAIELMVDNDRFDDAEKAVQNAGLQALPEVSKRVQKVIAEGRARAASASGADEADGQADVDNAISVLDDGATKTTKTTKTTTDPLATFTAKNKPATFANLKRDIGNLLSFISEKNAEMREQNGRKAAIKTWESVATGSPRRGTDAFKILTAAQTPEGKLEAANLYSQIRSLLSPEAQKALDQSFAGADNTRRANTPVPAEQRPGGSTDAVALSP